jgi:hypothetical protein
MATTWSQRTNRWVVVERGMRRGVERGKWGPIARSTTRGGV